MPRVSRPADLLFEIGTEELPAAYLPGLIEQLKRDGEQLLRASHLLFERVETYGAPRRLVLIVRGLAAVQRTPGQEIRGPSKRASYDKDSKPTQALLGFLRSQGGRLQETRIVSSEKGEYVHLTKAASDRPTAQVLPQLLPQLIGKLRAPKTMRWDATGVRFARPIRWLVAVYGNTPLRCVFGRVSSGTQTWVGLPLRPRRLCVTSVDDYLMSLKHARVILSQEERRQWIEGAVARIAKRARGTVASEMLGYGLLDEVTHLVEEPVPLEGAFDRRYLTLPREVLLASMAKHQRVFAVESSGELLPCCIAILEGAPRRPDNVRKVVERILNARLADSLLFWNNDARRPLDQLDLSGVSFHERLGSMREKTHRLLCLADVLADAWKLTPEEGKDLRRACTLAKTDLVTSMVKEFPTLQGIMGKHYALANGESQAVAQAIGEQYFPSAGRLPRTILGSALSILDKYDTLTSYFGVGIEPTGEQDPFGLRRAAQGIVESLWNAKHLPIRWPVRFPLDELFRQHSALRSVNPKDAETIGARVKRYLLERLYTLDWSADGARGAPPNRDCIDAVLGSPCDDLMDVMDRIVNLQRLSGHPGLLKAAKVIERTRNILKGSALRQHEVDPSRLQEPLERRLWDVYQSHEERFATLAGERQYAEATTAFGEAFYTPLHEFFDEVMVNVPEETLQQNRLALMQAIHALYTDRIADLSKLTVLQQQHEEQP